jgi:AraC family transcriptional regulator
MHTHDHLQVTIPLGPGAAIRATWESDEGRRHERRLGLDEVLVARPGQPHTLGWDGDGERVVLFLGPSVLAAATGAPERVPGVGAAVVHDPLIARLGDAVRAELHADAASASVYVESIAGVVAGRLARTAPGNAVEPPPIGALDAERLRRTTDFVQAHLDRDLALADLAGAAGLSPFHFARSFKRATGQSPHQHLVRARIERAKELLSRTALPIVEVGFRVGYHSQSHFTAQFRRHAGTTPAAYRAETRFAAR